MTTDLQFHGAHLDAERITATLDHLLQRNLALAEQGERGTPVCIWGLHGIGKTALVQEFAARQDPPWKIAYCAPAQFEEMGDLHGLPTRVDPDPTVAGNEYTTFLPPDWVPTEEGPGILLIDDINRADDRILRGLMQLLQNFEMFSWSLPPKWQIVATANPEGGDYSVTPMDDAMLTRMLHLTMEFDVKAWAAWAVRAGVDPRGIDFVLTYPEVVTGRRSTPRSLCQFFSSIQEIPDLRAELGLVSVLAQACLDEITVTSFVAYVRDHLQTLIQPQEILGAKSFASIRKRLKALATGKDGERRVDRLATICTRLYLHLAREEYTPEPKHAKNLVSFMLVEDLPQDLRFMLHRDLVALKRPALTEMLEDSRLATLILAGI